MRLRDNRPHSGTALNPACLESNRSAIRYDVHTGSGDTSVGVGAGIHQKAATLAKPSETWAGAGVRLVSSRGVSLRHTRESDEKDVGDRAVIGDLIQLAGAFDERLARAVRLGLALAADRLLNGERSLLDDDDRAARMRVPSGGTTGLDRDLRHGDIRPELKRDGPG